MTRTEYMEQLEKHLKKLPHKEYFEAINFFNEYFDEAGPEQEADIIEELGSPKEAASELINNILNKQIQEDKERKEPLQLTWKHWAGLGALSMMGLFSFFLLFIMGEFIGFIPLFATLILGAFFLGRYFRNFSQTKRTLWLAILAVISLPIAIPLLLILLASLLGLTALIVALIIGAFALGVLLLISGAYLIWEGFTLLSEGFNIFLMGFGSGLSLIGGAILIYILTGFFAYWSWRLVKACFKWILKRGKRA
ncbi:TPA: DUF1700 domain-containing protein [Streptococcus suis]|uniref:DUF1700 domain-containing protein n=1 Tax=Streptococcus iners subsp. hyiners TaxID=3028083 RepID=A0AA96VJM2_9STRE|nr:MULTISPECIES: DUF1700 domain-containing protein [Streptococcus]MCK4030014.1 DUF1700 domain-containing protein [Streptococcus suis]NQI70623.1 DUF1700 domain-containing protein [Streptococcus suis]WNY49313.1 DUF1700 domain-containing protein [Streptococcus sp. 29892]HEL9633612.1 DUF1700 domain-containing protein [Streptococcus suis]